MKKIFTFLLIISAIQKPIFSHPNDAPIMVQESSWRTDFDVALHTKEERNHLYLIKETDTYESNKKQFLELYKKLEPDQKKVMDGVVYLLLKEKLNEMPQTRGLAFKIKMQLINVFEFTLSYSCMHTLLGKNLTEKKPVLHGYNLTPLSCWLASHLGLMQLFNQAEKELDYRYLRYRARKLQPRIANEHRYYPMRGISN